MKSRGYSRSRKPLAGVFARQGYVLFLVCCLALVMMIMIISFSSQKSGEVLQLSRTIEQERIVLFAEAAINEMLAAVKAGVNDPTSGVGSGIFNFWKTGYPGGAKVISQIDFPADQLPVSNGMASDYLGNRVEVTGQVRYVAIDRINAARPSYAGYVELIGIAKSKDVPEIRLKERRELKIADLSYPFVDKYALFVKSFCRLWNNPEKKIIIQGIPPTTPNLYSFVYMGNRSYPECPEFPQGEKSPNSPPVLLDLCFKEDNHLLGSFYRPASFQAANNDNVQASTGNLFYVIPPFAFRTIANSFSRALDFHNTPELVAIYKTLVQVSAKGADTEGTMPYLIVRDYQKSGGDPGKSQVFLSLLESLISQWKYQYGYTDFSCISGDGSKTFVNRKAFSGILQYFYYYAQQNPQRLVGGKMPLLYGPNRDTPVFVEGPVNLRFFKVAFIDEAKVTFNLYGGSIDVPFPPVPLHFEDPPKTFSGKPCTPQIDDRTKVLMSTAIDVLSVNHLFFGVGKNVTKTPSSASGKVEGYDVFPAFDESLRNVAHVYPTAADFLADRVKMIDGKKVLDLDGISLVLSANPDSLDLSSVDKYRGKGRIVVKEGNCLLGNLAPLDKDKDFLSLYLMFGNITIKSAANSVDIYASLAATTCFSDNSSPSVSRESGINCGGKSVNICGNLIVDNLFELKTLPDGGQLTIVHDPKLYFPDYPVRVSIGETRSLLAADYAH